MLTGGLFASACVQVGFFLREAAFGDFASGLFLIIIEGVVAVKWLEVSGAFPRILAPFEEYAVELSRTGVHQHTE
jgi:H+/gluconate symporter-like permease